MKDTSKDTINVIIDAFAELVDLDNGKKGIVRYYYLYDKDGNLKKYSHTTVLNVNLK